MSLPTALTGSASMAYPLDTGSPPVLIVDDRPEQCEIMRRALQSRCACETATTVSAARSLMASRNFDLVLCDLDLGGDSGLELLRELPSIQPDAAVVVVTGNDEVNTAETAFNIGAYGYVVKPFRAVELAISVSNALRRRTLEIASRVHAWRLEERLLERTSALSSAVGDLEKARIETLNKLSLAVEARDRVTADHIDGMVAVVERFALRAGYSEQEAKELGIASMMHDLGKIGVPDSILLKPGPLTAEERELMELHPEIGYRMLQGSSNPLLCLGAEIAYAHHERWDGAGYPRGLQEEEIPLSARIVQIVDVFSAITTDRPYRDALPLHVARQELSEGAGSQFDPALVERFLENFEEIVG